MSGKKSIAAFSAAAANWIFDWPPPMLSAIEPETSMTSSVRLSRAAASQTRSPSAT